MRTSHAAPLPALVAVLIGLSALPAAADKPRLPLDPAYRAECGSCHVAYPPKLLPAQSWRELMARLDRHFGSDASLDARTGAEIGRYLAANAGRRDAPLGAEPRITETRWFSKEHDKEVPAALWKSTAVKSRANCAACHTRADDGDYSERSLRLPK
jgi:Dihaem cytochrome c